MDLRVRALAASLLAKAGNDGVTLLKKGAVLGGAAEDRARVLEVIEGVTRDLKAERAQTMKEENPKVRQAAFLLLERLNNTQAVAFSWNMRGEMIPVWLWSASSAWEN